MDMSKATRKLFGVLLSAGLLTTGFMLPVAPSAAGTKADRATTALGSPSGVVTKGKAFDYRKLKPKLSSVKYTSNQIDRFECPEGEPLCPEYSPVMSRPDDDAPAGNPVRVHIEVVRPKEVKPYPVILEASPYHGTIADRSGTRIFPGPKANQLPPWVDSQQTPGGVETDKTLGLAGYFAPRGYAVVFMDLRGTGMSGGCLDHLGRDDKADMRDTIDWITKQPWSNGRVGMTGHSYVGSTPTVAAAAAPKGLKTIVPSAGLGAMYHHKFQHGVPYFLQWIGPAEAYEELAINRFLPGELGNAYGESFAEEEFLPYIACGVPNSAAISLQDFESGRYDDGSFPPPPAWDTARDHRKGGEKAHIPVFAVHGVNDNAARIPALDWFHDRDGRKGDKAWIGQWDHGSNFYPNDRTCAQHSVGVPCPNDQWTLALHAWFDKHLKKKRINTGPSIELFLNDRGREGQGSGRSSLPRVYQPREWPPRPANNATWFYLSPEVGDNGLMKLIINEVKEEDAGSASFVGAPTNPILPASEFDAEGDLGENALGWETGPMKNDLILAGIPKQRLFASIAGDLATPPHVFATLYDIDQEGNVVCVPIYTSSTAQRCGISKGTFAMNPQLADIDRKDGHDNVYHPSKMITPFLTGPPCPAGVPCPHKYPLRTRGMAQSYLLERGHRLRLVVATSQTDKAPTRPDGAVTIYMGPDDDSRIGVAVVRNARLRKDDFYSTGGGDNQPGQ